jgi:hypothetical protein
MNQSQGHWLLPNALNICINLTLTLEAKVKQATDVFDALDAFDTKFIILQKNMQTKFFKVIKPFPQFLQAYDSH